MILFHCQYCEMVLCLWILLIIPEYMAEYSFSFFCQTHTSMYIQSISKQNTINGYITQPYLTSVISQVTLLCEFFMECMLYCHLHQEVPYICSFHRRFVYRRRLVIYLEEVRHLYHMLHYVTLVFMFILYFMVKMYL